MREAGQVVPLDPRALLSELRNSMVQQQGAVRNRLNREVLEDGLERCAQIWRQGGGLAVSNAAQGLSVN